MPADQSAIGSTSQPRRIAETLRAAAVALRGIQDTAPRREAELLLMEATGWTHTHLIAWPERELDPAAAARFEHLLARRLAGEPIAYLRGRQSFWSLELRVSPATLIPRPETELLVETALARLPGDHGIRVADLGTGSGAIAAAVASERPGWQLIATDRSPAALALARDNFTRLGLSKIRCLCTDWLDAFDAGSLHAILGNPPYIAEDDPHLAHGDLRFEPREALTPGGDGLGAIRRILREAPRCLRAGGLLAIEHGYDQGPRVEHLFRAAGLDQVETLRDLAGLDRVTLGYR